MRRRWLGIVVAVLAAPPGFAALVIDVDRGIAPALACSGFTRIAAVPDGFRDPETLPSNATVLLYDANDVLSQAPTRGDTLRMRQGSTQVAFVRTEVFPGLFMVTPTAKLEPGLVYELEWHAESEGDPVGEWRTQSRFRVSGRSDARPPRIGVIGPVDLLDSASRSSCDREGPQLMMPFAVEDESPVLVGVWSGPSVSGKPLGWATPSAGTLRVTLSSAPREMTFMAFDAAGHRSAPCSILVTPPAGRAGCGKTQRVSKRCTE